MKNTFLNKKIYLIITMSITMASCGKLEPQVEGAQGVVAPKPDAPVPAPDLPSVYNQLNQLVGQGNWFAMNEHSTDELMGPTRGTDWDDFGTWRKLHLHTSRLSKNNKSEETKILASHYFL